MLIRGTGFFKNHIIYCYQKVDIDPLTETYQRRGSKRSFMLKSLQTNEILQIRAFLYLFEQLTVRNILALLDDQ